MSSSPPSQAPTSKTSTARPFLSLPDVIRERIYFFVLTVDVDPRTPWITPLPSSRYTPKHLPLYPPEPDCNLHNVSGSVRKKRRRRMRAWEIAARAAAPASCLAILVTCRTILLEAFHLWYRNNTLNFAASEDLRDFLASIGPVRANEIRSIRLDLPALDWDDPKAGYGLGRLLGLEKLIFVYNDYSPGDTKPKNIPYPKIISRLRGLQQVAFVDPEDPKPMPMLWGLHYGMTKCVRIRMDELREKMVAKRKKPRCAPPMVDLFNRLRIVDQKRKGTDAWEWEEGLSYAPEIDG
ncbi:MAG: hypothetical protein Q9225_000664 [Loekoesia sp. 1 TL-2023]